MTRRTVASLKKTWTNVTHNRTRVARKNCGNAEIENKCTSWHEQKHIYRMREQMAIQTGNFFAGSALVEIIWRFQSMRYAFSVQYYFNPINCLSQLCNLVMAVTDSTDSKRINFQVCMLPNIFGTLAKLWNNHQLSWCMQSIFKTNKSKQDVNHLE